MLVRNGSGPASGKGGTREQVATGERQKAFRPTSSPTQRDIRAELIGDDTRAHAGITINRHHADDRRHHFDADRRRRLLLRALEQNLAGTKEPELRARLMEAIEAVRR